jgi:hypothetical protein
LREEETGQPATLKDCLDMVTWHVPELIMRTDLRDHVVVGHIRRVVAGLVHGHVVEVLANKEWLLYYYTALVMPNMSALFTWWVLSKTWEPTELYLVERNILTKPKKISANLFTEFARFSGVGSFQNQQFFAVADIWGQTFQSFTPKPLNSDLFHLLSLLLFFLVRKIAKFGSDDDYIFYLLALDLVSHYFSLLCALFRERCCVPLFLFRKILR